MIKYFTIKSNIDSLIINEFLNFYKNENKGSVNKIVINIRGQKESDSDFKGEIDPVFLSYIVLFLKEFPNIRVEFSIEDISLSGRAFSLKEQLKHIVFLYNELRTQIFLKNSIVSSDTGEIRTVLHPLDDKIVPSQKFIPLIFIQNKNDINKFFLQESKNDNKLYWKYKEKLQKEIIHRTKKENEKSDVFLNTLEIENLSFFEICLFNLLLYKQIYEKRNVKDDTKKLIIENDRERISKYRRFVKDVGIGIRELASNIVEHATDKRGVITCRLFDKKRLSELKGDVENDYLNQVNEDYFLDLNILDLGELSVRKTYLINLENQKKYLSGEEISKDLEVIKGYEYQDFFVVDFQKFIHVSHQQNKLISRYGLHYFTYIIKEYHLGFIKSYSCDEGIYLYKSIGGEDVKNNCLDFVRYGTGYNCIIPINKTMPQEDKVENDNGDEKKAYNIDGFIELDKFEIKNVEERKDILQSGSEKKFIYNIIFQRTSKSNKDKYEELVDIYNYIIGIVKNGDNTIFAFDANQLRNIENESQWVRLLSVLSLKIPDIIIYNIENAILYQILSIRKSVSYSDAISFWNDESRILFYSFKEVTDIYGSKYKRFGGTLLTGKSFEDFYSVNRNIWRHHYAFKKEFFMIDNVKYSPKRNIESLITKSKFFNNSNLLFFELLIRNEDEYGRRITLFEQSLQFSLNKEYKVYTQNTSNRGYKITGTHFKLGSKIHIRDFYYAKRLFQNSFFTLPLSYLISIYVYEIIKDKGNISLIGYEDYSSLLLSGLRNLLQRKIEKTANSYRINHNIIKDGKLLRDVGTLHENILIVVPIASTFSTSIKLYKRISEILRNSGLRSHEILRENINVLLVGHKKSNYTFENIANVPDKIDTSSLLYENDYFDNAFNWHSIDVARKTIKVKTINEKKEEIFLTQKYFIPVYTQWHNADDCKLCYPENIQKEECLIETSRTSITPNVIFDFPRTKEANQYGKGILALSSSLFYGNLAYGRNKYLYYTPTGRIVKENEEKISIWLEKIRNEIFSKHLKSYSKAVLVTPSTGCKSKFLDLVNNVIFGNTASILSIPLSEDYIENAESLYSDGLHESDVVIYVDDVLASTNSFIKINHIVQITKNKISTGEGINYCISLINRMPFDKENNVIINMKSNHSESGISSNNEDDNIRLLYYMKMNCPPIEEPDNKFPLDLENDRYKHLADTSSIDAVRQLFLSKTKKIDTIDISNNAYNLKKDYSSKKVFQLLVLNQLYLVFSNENKENIKHYFVDRIEGLEELEEFLVKKLNKDKANENVIKLHIHNLRCVILKLLCSTPQIYYKDLRNSVFSWVKHELKIIEEEIDKLYEIHTNTDLTRPEGRDQISFYIGSVNNFFSSPRKGYSKYQHLKFLLKRSVQLKSNYIIHPNFFETINKIITVIYDVNIFIRSEIYESYHLEEEENLFSVQMRLDLDKLTSKRVIYQFICYVKELIDEHENKAIELEKNIEKFRKNYPERNKNGDFSHYLRLLAFENNESIENFCNSIVSYGNRITSLRLDFYKTDPRYHSIISYLQSEEKSFDKFLEIKSLLHNTQHNSDALKETVNKILLGISELIGIDNVKAAYLTVNYKNTINITPDGLFLFAWAKDKKYRYDYLNDESLQKSITFEMIKGIVDAEQYTLSNIEICKKNGILNYREGFFQGNNIEQFNEVLVHHNEPEFSLLVIRISDLVDNKNDMYSQAALSIIMKEGERIDYKKMRLILLLRKSISNFLKNESSNNTFLELLENRNVKRYQKRLRHSTGNFLGYMKEIVQEYEGIESKIDDYEGVTRSSLDQIVIEKASFPYKEFSLLFSSIASQTNVNMNDYKSKQPFFYDYFVDIYRTIFESEKLGLPFCESLNFEESVTFLNLNKFESFSIPYIVRNSIIPEIIINQKKYGNDRTVNWKSRIETVQGSNIIFLDLIFSNKISVKSKSEKSGLKMCEEICDRCDGANLEVVKNEKTNEFTVILSLKANTQVYEKENIHIG